MHLNSQYYLKTLNILIAAFLEGMHITCHFHARVFIKLIKLKSSYVEKRST